MWRSSTSHSWLITLICSGWRRTPTRWWGMPMSDFPGWIIGGIGGAVTAVLGYLGTRFTTRSARRASQDDWNARYRSSAEKHLMWDVDRRADILELRAELNQIRTEMGKLPRQFEEIPAPPSLFPRDKE